jgi:hypothetical protein
VQALAGSVVEHTNAHFRGSGRTLEVEVGADPTSRDHLPGHESVLELRLGCESGTISNATIIADASR